MTEPNDAPTPPAQVNSAPVGLWLVATSTVLALGVVTHIVPVPPTGFAWRVVPAQEAEELPAATDAPASAAASVLPPPPTAAATEPPVPPAAPATDAPGVEACARAAERLAYSTSYEAAITAFDLCMPGAGRPETVRDLAWRYAKLLVDGYREAEARRMYEAIASNAPEVPQSHNRLAWYLLTTSEYRSPQQLSADRARALVAAEEAVRLSNRQDNKILDTLAEALLQNGRRDDALRVLEEIATLTRKPIYPSRLEQFVAGKSRFMLTHEYSAEHQQGRAWTQVVERLSDEATLGELSEDELRALTPVERSTLRNAIFARHGQRLGVRWLDDIFAQRLWYHVNLGFNAERDLTPLDLRNIAVIRAIEAGLPVPMAADSPAPPGEVAPGVGQAAGERRVTMSVDELLETNEGDPAPMPNTTGDSGNAGYVRTPCGAIRAPNGALWYVGPDQYTPYARAQIWAENLGACGGGWRLPKPHEIAGIYEPGKSAGIGFSDGARRYPARLDSAFGAIGQGSWAWTSIRDNAGFPKALNLYTGGFVSLSDLGRTLDLQGQETTVRAIAVKP